MAEELQDYTKKTTLAQTAGSLMARQERLIQEGRDATDKAGAFSLKTMAGIGTLMSVLAAADSIYARSAKRNIESLREQGKTTADIKLPIEIKNAERINKFVDGYADVKNANEAWNHYKITDLLPRIAKENNMSEEQATEYVLPVLDKKSTYYQNNRPISDRRWAAIKAVQDGKITMPSVDTLRNDFVSRFSAMEKELAASENVSLLRRLGKEIKRGGQKVLGREVDPRAQTIYSQAEITKELAGLNREGRTLAYSYNVMNSGNTEIFMNTSMQEDFFRDATLEEIKDPALFRKRWIKEQKEGMRKGDDSALYKLVEFKSKVIESERTTEEAIGSNMFEISGGKDKDENGQPWKDNQRYIVTYTQHARQGPFENDGEPVWGERKFESARPDNQPISRSDELTLRDIFPDDEVNSFMQTSNWGDLKSNIRKEAYSSWSEVRDEGIKLWGVFTGSGGLIDMSPGGAKAWGSGRAPDWLGGGTEMVNANQFTRGWIQHEWETNQLNERVVSPDNMQEFGLKYAVDNKATPLPIDESLTKEGKPKQVVDPLKSMRYNRQLPSQRLEGDDLNKHITGLLNLTGQATIDYIAQDTYGIAKDTERPADGSVTFPPETPIWQWTGSAWKKIFEGKTYDDWATKNTPET